MRKTEIPIEWLVCPETKVSFKQFEDNLVSENGTYKKNKEYEFWNFIPNELKIFDKKRWDSWNILQENATIPYNQESQKNLGVGPRKDFIQFANFCDFKGLILDVGVGPQKLPSHIEYNTKTDVRFIGIDPLVGEQPRGFSFVQGLGEYLPFKDDLFDQVLFVTSLDHFIDPVVALIEAKRVLKKEGDICVWLGEKDKNTPKPKESPDWYKKLKIPEGAEDPFHLKRFNNNEFENYLENVKLKIVEKEIHLVDEWRKNVFYRIR